MTDRIRTAPDTVWRPVGTGLSSTFRCAKCSGFRQVAGRQRLLVAGVLHFCCAPCVLQASARTGRPLKQRVLDLGANVTGFTRRDIKAIVDRKNRPAAEQMVDLMLADGQLFEGRHRLQRHREATHIFASVAGLVAWQQGSVLTVPHPLRRAPRTARNAAAAVAAKPSPEVKRTFAPWAGFDPRYQCDPRLPVQGAGFVAVGIGRDVLTGQAWEATATSAATSAAT